MFLCFDPLFFCLSFFPEEYEGRISGLGAEGSGCQPDGGVSGCKADDGESTGTGILDSEGLAHVTALKEEEGGVPELGGAPTYGRQTDDGSGIRVCEDHSGTFFCVFFGSLLPCFILLVSGNYFPNFAFSDSCRSFCLRDDMFCVCVFHL